MAFFKKNNYYILIIYFSIILGFLINEDSLGGAYSDYNTLNYVAQVFKDNFTHSFLNYDELNHRQSPVFYILKSFFLEFTDTTQRLIFLHFFLLIPIFFYKCLKLKFHYVEKE